MRYKVNKATGIVIREALSEDIPDEFFDIVESTEELSNPELHVFHDGAFHADFDLYTEATKSKREAHLVNLQIAYESKRAEPVVVTNLRFNADNATLDIVNAEINSIETSGNFSSNWSGVPDVNGVSQFNDAGRSPSSILVELIDLKQSILNTKMSLDGRLAAKRATVQGMDVLQALMEFDSSSI